MYKHGGMKLNLLTTDFKYIQDPTRIMWSQSVVKNMQKIVDLIANIPYRNFSYDGPIYYLIKIYKLPDAEDDTEAEADIDTTDNLLEKFYEKIDSRELGDFSHDVIDYNFFGGIVFELLNDTFPNVNLHKYVDPTSDIDVSITLNGDLFAKSNEIIHRKLATHSESRLEQTLVYEDESKILKLNPFYKSISEFIHTHLLNNLHTLGLNFKNSVPFEDTEYYAISHLVKNDNMGYKVDVIEGTNAKLFTFIDDNYNTIRIQLVLKMIEGNLSIIDHFFEFLITSSVFASKQKYLKIMNNNNYQLSSLNILFYDNLEAYVKRQYFPIQPIAELRHKGLNHIFRIIYLLDLFKHNPSFYNTIPRLVIGQMRKYFNDYLQKSYIFYTYIDGLIIHKKIQTKYILLAFYSIINSFSHPFQKNLTATLGNVTNPGQMEEPMYIMLSNFFDLNSSSFRRFINNTPIYINFLQNADLSQNGDLSQNSRTQLTNQLKQRQDSYIEERKTLQNNGADERDEIKKLNKRYMENLPEIQPSESGFLKGGKSRRKYRRRKSHRRKSRHRKSRHRKSYRRKSYRR